MRGFFFPSKESRLRALFSFNVQETHFYKTQFFIQMKTQYQLGSILETWIKTMVTDLFPAFLHPF